MYKLNEIFFFNAELENNYKNDLVNKSKNFIQNINLLNKNNNDTSSNDTSSNDTSSNDTSGNDTSGNDTSGYDTSGNDTSGNDTSGNDTSGYDTLEYIISILNKSSRQCRIVTGGIGDFIALDYLFNFSLKYDLIFITTHSLTLKKIINYYYKNNYFAFYFNFNIIGKPGFDTTKELLKNIPEIRFIKNIDFINISDYFPVLIKNNLIKFPEKMKYLNYTIFDLDKSDIIKKFNLPENIAFISPYTKNSQKKCIKCNSIHEIKSNCNLNRNFIYLDYLNAIEILKKNELIGIIVSVDKIELPDKLSSYFINLSEKLDIIESIEILKKCKYFIGIDSCFSVFASKILKNENIIIKSNNNHLFLFEKIYYYPNTKKQLKNFI